MESTEEDLDNHRFNLGMWIKNNWGIWHSSFVPWLSE